MVRLARLLLVLACVLVLLPLGYMVGTAFKPESEVFASVLNPVPLHPTLQNFGEAVGKLNYFRLLAVSVIFAGGVTLGQLLIAIPAAYQFARRDFWGSDVLFAVTIATLPIPFVVTYVPNYLLLAHYHQLNTFGGLIVPQIASAYGIFLLRQHFRSFPRSVLEAAQIDGASTWSTLWRIVVPANLSVLFALAVYIFVNTWNQYIWPLLVASNPKLHTLTVGVQDFAGGEGGSHWGALMAAATLATLPAVVVFLAARRQILSTLMEGAVKG